jgi:Zn-dependent protease
MGLIRLLFDNPAAFVLVAIPLLFSLIIHEVAHGWVADKMGDSTARWMGRLNLNPMRHLDPVGTIMLFFFGFGWAKPVPINPNNFRNYRKGLILVSAAGITANIILAFLGQLLFVAWNPGFASSLTDVLRFFIQINIMLAAFNLIPIPPLDGSKILMGFSSRRFQLLLERFEPYGFFVILALLYLGILDPLIYFFRWVIATMIGLVIH